VREFDLRLQEAGVLEVVPAHLQEVRAFEHHSSEFASLRPELGLDEGEDGVAHHLLQLVHVLGLDGFLQFFGVVLQALGHGSCNWHSGAIRRLLSTVGEPFGVLGGVHESVQELGRLLLFLFLIFDLQQFG